MAAYERLLTVVNPYSSYAHRVRDRVDSIRERYRLPYVEVHTSADSRQTVEYIEDQAEDGDVCLIAGGDGTVHDAVTALTGTNVPILPLWGGNGNDMAHIANGQPSHRPPHELLARGQAVPIRPLTVAVEGLGAYYAGLYTGYGGTGRGTKRLNQASYRKLPGYRNRAVRLLYEAATLGPIALTTRPFHVSEPSGTTYRAIDVTVANGPRMAKVGRPPVGLEEPRAIQFSCTSRARVPLWAGALATGRVAHREITPNAPYRFSVDQPVVGHVDAEPFILEPEQQVTVGISPVSFQLISTRLAPPEDLQAAA